MQNQRSMAEDPELFRNFTNANNSMEASGDKEATIHSKPNVLTLCPYPHLSLFRRNKITQPRVARHELPWGEFITTTTNPEKGWINPAHTVHRGGKPREGLPVYRTAHANQTYFSAPPIRIR